MIDPSRALELTTVLTRSWMSGVDFGGKKWSGGRLAAPNMTVICAIASNQDPPGTSIRLFRPCFSLSRVWRWRQARYLVRILMTIAPAWCVCWRLVYLWVKLYAALNVGLSLFVWNVRALLRSRGFELFWSLMTTAILSPSKLNLTFRSSE